MHLHPRGPPAVASSNTGSLQYSKSFDPLQPWAAGVSSLLARVPLDSTDVTVIAFNGGSAEFTEFRLHKFLLSARSLYFRRKLEAVGNTGDPDKDGRKIVRNVRLANSVDARAFETAVKFMYLGEVVDSGHEDVMANVERLSRHLEMPELWEMVVETDQKKQRQKRTDAVEKALEDMDSWFKEFVLAKKICVDSPEEAKKVKVQQSNESFADVLLQAEETDDGQTKPKTVLYPVHKGMLRSEFFTAMFTGNFKEGRKLHETEPLSVIPIDASPAVLELVLSFLYSEKGEIPLEHALDCLFAAEQLLLDRLKQKCSHVISSATQNDDLPFSICDVVRTGWLCRVRRLEEFGAKYIADRLEQYLDDPELAELVAESAERIKERQETDTIELVDDIRYYLGLRFRQRIGEEDPLFDGGDDGEELDEIELSEQQDEFFDRQEAMQNELLEKIDELLGGFLNSPVELIPVLTRDRKLEIGCIDGLLDAVHRCLIGCTIYELFYLLIHSIEMLPLRPKVLLR